MKTPFADLQIVLINDSFGLLLSVFTIAVSIISTLIVGRHIQESLKRSDYYEASRSRILLMALVFGIFADTVIFARGFMHIKSYTGLSGLLKSLSATSYVFNQGLFFLYCYLKLFHRIRAEINSVILFITYSILCITVVVMFTDSEVLLFFNPTDFNETYLRYCFHLYTVFSSLNTAAVVTYSMRSDQIKDILFSASFFIIFCSDAPIRYIRSAMRSSAISIFDIGIAVAYFVMTVSLYGRSHERWFSSQLLPANSLRSWLSFWFIFAVGAGAAAATFIVSCGYPPYIVVSLILFVTFFFWAASNVYGIEVSKCFLLDRQALKHAILDKDPEPDSKLGKVRFFEFKLFASDLIKMVRKTIDERTLIRQAQSTIMFFHDSKSRLQLLASTVDKLGIDPHIEGNPTYQNLKRLVYQFESHLRSSERRLYAKEGEKEQDEVTSLNNIIDTVLTDTTEQHRHNLDLDIQFVNKLDGLVFVAGHSSLVAAFQNFVNNSIAYRKPGLIQIKIHAMMNEFGGLEVTISDNGVGIPKNILGVLGQSRIDNGTPDRGQGVLNSAKVIRELGGSLEIESNDNGTTIRIGLPSCPPPRWYTDRILLTPGCKIVVVDDDLSIHEMWRSVYIERNLQAHGIELLGFTNEAQLSDFLLSTGHSPDYYFFLDYQLADGKKNSLKLIPRFQIGARTTIVTSYEYYEDLQTACVNMGARLVSKRTVFHLPIEVVPNRPDFVFLEDDRMTIEIWKEFLNKLGKTGLFLTHDLDVFRLSPHLDKSTVFILDEELPGQKGSDIAKLLSEQQFESIYICSSHHVDKFKDLKFLSGVFGKTPDEEILSKVFGLNVNK